MSLVGKIQNRAGQSYVHVVFAFEDEPTARHLWYAITGVRRTWIETPDEDQEVSYDSTSHYWRNAHGIVYAEAEATIDERTPIPRPKVRAGVETRWYQGRWEKYSKTRGWVPA